MPATRPAVLSFREARSELGHTLDRFREGTDAEIVYFGSHRRAEAAIVSIEVVDQLISRLDDAEIAAIVRERRDMAEVPLSDVAARFGVDLDKL